MVVRVGSFNKLKGMNMVNYVSLVWELKFRIQACEETLSHAETSREFLFWFAKVYHYTKLLNYVKFRAK